MPKTMPPEIAAFVKQHAPPGHNLIWLRCRLLKPPVPIERPPLVSQLLMGRKPPIPQDTLLELLDIDESKGWDLRLVGTGHDIVAGDIFSAIGQTAPGSDRLEKITFVFNHKTGIYLRAYPDISTASNLNNEIKYKRSLSYWERTNPVSFTTALLYTLRGYYTASITPARDRFRNIVLTAIAFGYVVLLNWLGPGGGGEYLGQQTFLHPWLALLTVPLSFVLGLILFGLLLLPVVVAVQYLVYLVQRLIYAVYEPPRFKDHVEYSFAELIGFDNLKLWLTTTRTDATFLFQDVGNRLHEWVKANPEVIAGKTGDTPVFVVGQMRGQGDKGVLAAPKS